jgi:hypothetical protein
MIALNNAQDAVAQYLTAAGRTTNLSERTYLIAQAVRLKEQLAPPAPYRE